jgi:hypothetical protein
VTSGFAILGGMRGRKLEISECGGGGDYSEISDRPSAMIGDDPL